ncbi:hypothetical protein D0T84_14590 [Dysgonomonas sp. 521]|uniref:hypothetical protein n=1 Tax=Dysgonomonas sp. 521 TaxID=2302932 RepID=UPI0013D24A91|nr:hypothetical protein [Dysgonomonas sp. 521]NDV96130.1 hypothetical protein [Dysgonomonas sp. 521]
MKTTKTQNKNMAHWRLLLATAAFLLCSSFAGAQVTVGSNITPTRAALLDLKARQTTATIPSVNADENITSALGDGGLLLPRVKLIDINTLEPFIAKDDAEYVANTNSLKERLAGLMVYNVTDNGAGSTLYPAVYTWDGTKWRTERINEAGASIMVQPKPFTFYETGEETVKALEFVVDGLGTWTYQWYQVTGNNVHVRIGTAVGKAETIYTNTTDANAAGATSPSFTPNKVIKGSKTTRNANNTGFYKFYCVAKSSLGAELTSDIAEVAVGCGAKNNDGEWISFMCFNLGAQNGITIQEQKDYPIGTFTNDASGMHTYIPGEENVWGGLFQWGRIADGHELRSFTGAGGTPTNIQAYSGVETAHIINGNRCSTTDTPRPYQQVKEGTAGYGKFIYGNVVNWTPIAQATADQLWRTGRFIQNDPCAHYKTDGSYHEFWHNGADGQNKDVDGVIISEACTDAGTAWRTPSQDEWGSIYRGGAITGSPGNATANTWSWYGGTSTLIDNSRGCEIKPDGETTTLFLPASGYRSNGKGLLYYQSVSAFYLSYSINGINTYNLNFGSSYVNPANSSSRVSGFALRCIKNN